MSDPIHDSTTSSKTAPSSPHPIARFFKRLFYVLIFLALSALVLFLLSERNSHLFKLELSEKGTLVVLRGRHLPLGFAPWISQDLQLAQTYAPFELDAAVLTALDLTQVYGERDALDRVLFDLHREAIEQRTGSTDAQKIEEIVRLLQRAERLAGLSDSQKLQLRDLQIRTAFFEGRQRLQEAALLLQKALTKLRLAADGEDSRYTAAAESLLLSVQDKAKSLMNIAAALPTTPPPSVQVPGGRLQLPAEHSEKSRASSSTPEIRRVDVSEIPSSVEAAQIEEPDIKSESKEVESPPVEHDSTVVKDDER